MQIKTITTAAGVNEIDFGNDDSQTTAHYYWFKNLSNSTLYVSAVPAPVAGEDNVAELSAKGAASVETDEGKVYVLGAGKVEIHRTNSKFCPFELPSTGSGGGGGGSITVDSELSETSENPLQNKATTAAINEVKSDLAKTQEDVAENAAALCTKSDINHIHDITASGNPVILTNLQGEVPFSEITVKGKNLIEWPYYVSGDRTFNGITFTDNNDGTITANGTATNDAIYFVRYRESFKLKPGNYVLSGCPAGGSKTTFYQWLGIWDGSTNIYGVHDVGDSVKATLTEEMLDKYIVIGCYIYAGATVDGITFCPQLEFGDTATAYEPPVTSQEVTITRCGKNLINNYGQHGTSGGITVTANDDGTTTINGTATSDGWILFMEKCPIAKGKTYTFSTGVKTGVGIVFGVRSEDATELYLSTRAFGSFVAPVTGFCRIRAFIGTGATFDNVTIYPQLELGVAATEYEPYHADTISVTPASNPYTIQNDLLQYDDINTLIASIGELSVIGVQKNAAIKRIWGNMGMDLLFDGVTDESNPAVCDINGYSNIVVSVMSKYSDDIISTGTIIMAVDDIITSISDGIKRYFSTGSRAATINISGTINNCAIVFAPYNTGDTILNCKIYGVK